MRVAVSLAERASGPSKESFAVMVMARNFWIDRRSLTIAVMSSTVAGVWLFMR